ncbi:alpha/beta hydrolase [Arthrobacter sp. TES]|uniref:alpha/beta fold hydrolase n=1 Tax=Paenarthrobacter TaxID=1742992 RepID=UPI000397C62F|nr:MULTISPECIES: alpha/beta hydrolase [Paenarthrobacter]AOY73262.1 alphabeta hydrolase [Arthrobacter sp. ZXY-2]ERI39012.1 alpha/beta hydrolase [Arthrobacter sp. AK-YN10]QOI64816.1 alpha/beta hydrolase [Arthrobacter sp. TES]MCX8456015.1 alpha/beta hydrolase [Paenarthrobacter ureafaciens]MCY0975099.1 alpha/beta hydrolase [Paenarthrobacter ureafaciens]
METWTVETNDGGGQLEVHTFRPVSNAAIPGSQAPAEPSGVVMIHGTLVTDSLYWPFALNLSRMLGRPVHCYNRRGRGRSAPQPPDYSVETEVADLGAVMDKSGSTDVVAHSYGGFVALNAVLKSKINRLVTYDAAVSLSGNLHGRWRPELEEAVTAGQLDQAWAHLVQGLGTAGPISYLPMSALRTLSIISAQTRLGFEMRSLLPTAVTEMRAVLAADLSLDDFRSLQTPTLMLSGGWSPSYFAETGRTLANAVPAIDFAIVPLQFHEGPLRPGRRLASRVARFLSGGHVPAPVGA